MNCMKKNVLLALLLLCGCGRSTTLAPDDLLAIRMLPEDPQLYLEQSVQLVVEGHLVDGSVVDLIGEPGLVFRLNQEGIVNVLSGARLRALHAGSVRLTAAFGGKEDSIDVTVRYALLEGIEASPAVLQMQKNEYVQLEITGNLSDGSTLDLTDSATGTVYTTGDATVATVTTEGLVFSSLDNNGRTEITVTHGEHAATVTVYVGELESIDVVPAVVGLEVGETAQLQVIGTYADGSVDLTGHRDTSYASSDASVATVGSAGLVTGVSSGEAAITVEHRDHNAVAYVTVTGASELIGIEVEPDLLQLHAGETAGLAVWANYSDGSRRDVTADAAYHSSDTGTARVAAGGLVTAVGGPGEATVTASYGGYTDDCRVLVGGELLFIDVLPPSAQLDIHERLQLEVMAFYSDGSTSEVTLLSAFDSSDPAVAAVGDDGQVQAIAEGTAVITAGYQGFSDTAQIRVNPPVFESIQVEPDMVTLPVGYTQQLVVWAHYSDGSRREVTGEATYMPPDNGVVSVSPGGLVTALMEGEASILVNYQGEFDTCRVYVQDIPIPILVEVFPANVTMDIGDTVNLFVRATYSDGSTENVTSQAGYHSSDPLVAGVDSSGVVTAHGGGTATITASFGGLSDDCRVNVQQQNPRPTLDTLAPDQVPAGGGDTVITLHGTGFIPDSTARLDSLNLQTTFASATRLTAVVPAAEISDLGAHQVNVHNPPPGGGLSNALPFYAVSAPAVTTLSPDSGLQGTVVRVVFYGSGLLGCGVTPQNPGIGVSGVSCSGDGTQLSATFAIGSAAAPGTGPVTLSNLAGSTTVTFTVIEDQPLEDLIIGPGEVVFLSGVQSYHDIVVGTGARVYGTGTVPLQFLATGRVTVRGEIFASGHSGADGYYDPAGGGAAGPGGSGGGGGADGDAAAGAPGGAGSPAGQPAEAGQGAGTPSGDGGGAGFGSGISGGCGQAGGGGGFGGDGGAGGGDSGAGSGGAGGLSNPQGSGYNGGTGGGGGSCCGQNSGGGGGGGGGVLVISAVSGGDIVIDGALYADGGRGGDGFLGTGGGGGGSGGRVTITTEGGTILINDTVSARGGDGGNSDRQDGGGGGGGGRIIIDAGSGAVDDTLGYYDIRGGPAGTSRETGFEGLPGSPGIVDVRP